MPPDPPADDAAVVGGASGMVNEISAPDFTLMIVISCGNGIGMPASSTITQFRAMSKASKGISVVDDG